MRVKVTKVFKNPGFASKAVFLRTRLDYLNGNRHELSDMWYRGTQLKVHAENAATLKRVKDILKTSVPKDLKSSINYGNILLEGYIEV